MWDWCGSVWGRCEEVRRWCRGDYGKCMVVWCGGGVRGGSMIDGEGEGWCGGECGCVCWEERVEVVRRS